MEIKKVELNMCDKCFDKAENKIYIDSARFFFLCDDCLQELNRKIVEHLAEKNI